MTDTIGSIYSNFIKEKFIKDKLKQGVIPSPDEIDFYLKEMQEKYNNFSSPLLDLDAFFVSDEDESSSSRTNEMFNFMEMDLSVAVKSLMRQGQKISDLYDSSHSRLKSFEKRIEDAGSSIRDLLFGSRNTDRHEALFYEKFESTKKVDLVSTTANIDDVSNTVTLKVSSDSIIPIEPSDQYIEVVPSNDPSINSSEDTPGLDVVNLANSSGNIWQHQVMARQPLSQTHVDVIIRIPTGQTEVNKIVLEPANVNIKTQVNIELAYSNDKLNWLFPDGERKKRLVKKTTFDFKNTPAEYWRLRLTKFGNDGFFGNSYSYNFGLKNVLLLGKKYEKINRHDRSLLYSTVIDPQGLDTINAINIRVCDTKPDMTEIDYEIAPLTESQIEGYGNGSILLEDLYFYPVILNDVDSVTLDLLKLAAEGVNNSILAVDSINYTDQKDGDFALDVLIEDFNKNSTVIMRGAGDNTESSTPGKVQKLRENPEGWSYNGIYYSTSVMVESKNGETIDLGDTEMIINGKNISGKAVLKPGINHIVSPKRFWKTLDLTTLPQSDTETVDPLYPYNHKYLIEGVNSMLYSVDLTQVVDTLPIRNVIDPDNVYSTKRLHWERKMKEDTFGVFESKSNLALDVFSYKMDNINQERIVVKSMTENGLMNRERFSIISKIQDSSPIKGLIFKAELSTEDVKTTPVLTEYLLKFR